MAIVIDTTRTRPRAIQLRGGSVEATFEAHSTSGAVSARASYFLADEEPYSFAGGGKELTLEPVDLAQPRRTFSRELAIEREPGGGRRMRLDILLVVEEVGRPSNAAEQFFVLSFSRTLGAEMRALTAMSSRREVAEMLNISESTLARIERDDHIPSSRLLEKLPRSKDEAEEMME